MHIFRSILTRKLKSKLAKGRLDITFPDGHLESFGDKTAKPIKIAITSHKWLRAIVLNPELQLGEAYMDGGLVIRQGNLYGLLELFWKNIMVDPNNGSTPSSFFQMMMRSLDQFNPRGRAAKNVAHHYDIGNDLYQLFLDEDMQYSCAYYPDKNTKLREAQKLKKDHIARKLNLKKGNRVLDIGCGWGGMALHLACFEDTEVHGVTLSQEQLQMAKARAERSGLTSRVTFDYQDYRNLDKRYDRIVSVGMLEHVGAPHYRQYFKQIARLLDEDGVALIHTIGRKDGPGATSQWIDRHIFPGGYIPALSELLPAIEKAGLQILDIEVLRLHYAETLKDWRANFNKNYDKILALYDERFMRMWEFYLVCSELSFRYGVHNVFQLQLGKKQDAVPLTRDYLYERELPDSLPGYIPHPMPNHVNNETRFDN